MRVVIIGFGSIARKHLQAIRQLEPKVEVYALRSSKSASIEEGVVNIYSYDEIVELEPLFVLISNPTVLRSQTVGRLIPLHIPLFIEKPVLANLEDAGRISQQIASAGLLTYTACNLRFLPCLQFLRKNLVQQGLPNEVNAYCGSYLPDWRPNRDYQSVYSANADMGGGVPLDLIHEIDYLYWLFGVPQFSTARFRSVSTLDISAIDYANYVLEYPRFTASVLLNYYRRDYRRQLEIVFPEVTWMVDLARNSITDGLGNSVFKGLGSIADTYLPQMENFLKLIRGEESANYPFDESVEVLKIALNHE